MDPETLKENIMIINCLLACCLTSGLTNIALLSDDPPVPEKAQSEIDVTTVKDEDDQSQHRVKVRVSNAGDVDVEQDAVVTGKIVIVGPDGKVREISLGDKTPERVHVQMDNIQDQSKDSQQHDVFVLSTDDGHQTEHLMIGVHCVIADEVLRGHLNLGDSGLVVKDVIDDSPAKAAGIQEGDVIVEANGNALATVEQLMEITRATEGKEITFNVIHAGERRLVNATPQKMKPGHRIVINRDSSITDGDDKQRMAFHWEESLGQELPAHVHEAMAKGHTRIMLRSMHPGIVIDHNSAKDDIRKLVDEARSRAEEQRAAAENLRIDSTDRLIRRPELPSRDARTNQIEELQLQMKKLQEQMADIQASLQELTSSEKR